MSYEHEDGEPCDCPKCEEAAANSRAEALADTDGWHQYRERTSPPCRRVSNCCLAPETEAYPEEHQLCPRCKEHCVFIREDTA